MSEMTDTLLVGGWRKQRIWGTLSPGVGLQVRRLLLLPEAGTK